LNAAQDPAVENPGTPQTVVTATALILAAIVAAAAVYEYLPPDCKRAAHTPSLGTCLFGPHGQASKSFEFQI
jgi:hypothetical protein